jgi:hypothetical protein
LSPLLGDAAPFPDDESPRQGIPNVLSLREENARLRSLAIQQRHVAQVVALDIEAVCN